MRRVLVLALALFSVNAFAAEVDCKQPVVKKKVAVSACTRNKQVKPKPFVHPPIVVVKEPAAPIEKERCCDTGSKQNQSVNVNVTVTPPKGETTAKAVSTYTVKRVVRKIVVKDTDPNRLLLMLGAAKTDIKLKDIGCCQYEADPRYTPDLGLQYLRDIGSFTGAIMLTTEKSVYLGLGFNW